MAAGADGLIIEVHENPATALSDGQQAISLEQLQGVISDSRKIAAMDGRSFSLALPKEQEKDLCAKEPIS